MKKLNQIIKYWKPNTIFTSVYFQQNDIYPQLVNKYLKSNWLEKIGNGAYIKAGDNVDLFGAINAIQEQLKLPIYIGSKTSLSLHGLSHYTNQKLPYFEIYSLNKTKSLPSWFINYDWKTKIIYSPTNLFKNNSIGITKKTIESLPILISSPERAIFELLNTLLEKSSFDETYKIIEGLYNLRPDLLNKLLQECSSIKVKRLFLYFAEKSDQPWFEDIETKSIDLGHGKREIFKKGILDKKYLITVPKELANEI